MKGKLVLLLVFTVVMLFTKAQLSQPDHEKVNGGELTIQPVQHASIVLSYHNKNLYIDPAGGAALFKGLAVPDVIIITDIHGDHFDTATLNAINTNNAVFVVPQAVADKLPATVDKQRVTILKNGDEINVQDIAIKAIPMYNLPEAPDAFIPKAGATVMCLLLAAKIFTFPAIQKIFLKCGR